MIRSGWNFQIFCHGLNIFFAEKKTKVKSSRRDYAISIKNCADILLHKLCFKLHVTPASNKSTLHLKQTFLSPYFSGIRLVIVLTLTSYSRAFPIFLHVVPVSTCALVTSRCICTLLVTNAVLLTLIVI